MCGGRLLARHIRQDSGPHARDLHLHQPGTANANSARQGYNHAMQTILREGACRFYFVSADRYESPHIHVRRDDGFAKFWRDLVELQSSGNFSRPELRRILRIVEQNQVRFLEEWNDYFDS